MLRLFLILLGLSFPMAGAAYADCRTDLKAHNSQFKEARQEVTGITDLKAHNSQFKEARQEVTGIRKQLVSLKQELDELGEERARLKAWYEQNWSLGEDGKNRPAREIYAAFLDTSIRWAETMKATHEAHLAPLKAQLPLHRQVSEVGQRVASAAEAVAKECPSERASKISAWGHKNVADGQRAHEFRSNGIDYNQREAMAMEQLGRAFRFMRALVPGG